MVGFRFLDRFVGGWGGGKPDPSPWGAVLGGSVWGGLVSGWGGVRGEGVQNRLWFLDRLDEVLGRFWEGVARFRVGYVVEFGVFMCL